MNNVILHWLPARYELAFVEAMACSGSVHIDCLAAEISEGVFARVMISADPVGPNGERKRHASVSVSSSPDMRVAPEIDVSDELFLMAATAFMAGYDWEEDSDHHRVRHLWEK